MMTALRRARRALAFVKAAPRWVQLAVLVGTLLASGSLWLTRTYHDKVAEAEHRGRDGERAAARERMTAYVLAIAPLIARRDTAMRATDSTLRRHTQLATAAAAAIAAVPARVRQGEPTVDVALEACVQLIGDTTAITRAVLTERTTWRAIHVADSSALFDVHLMLVAKDDTIATLTRQRDRKPGWGTVAKVGGTVFTAGVAIGRFVVPWLQRQSH